MPRLRCGRRGLAPRAFSDKSAELDRTGDQPEVWQLGDSEVKHLGGARGPWRWTTARASGPSVALGSQIVGPGPIRLPQRDGTLTPTSHTSAHNDRFDLLLRTHDDGRW